jgi:hypothetical protein
MRTVACMLNLLGRRVNCISWYFSGANVAPGLKIDCLVDTLLEHKAPDFENIFVP